MIKWPLRTLLAGLNIPKNELILLHVRLKNLMPRDAQHSDLQTIDYSTLSRAIVDITDELYQPRGILVPTFTYSFTNTAIFDRRSTVSEAGRFGEEVRTQHPIFQRLLEPVFSMVDCHKALMGTGFRLNSAFGEGSLWSILSEIGFVSVNINVPGLFGTYLHFLENKHKVPYRYSKWFSGRISPDGEQWSSVDYEYYVRRLDRDTEWKREKIARDLSEEGVLHEYGTPELPLRWFRTKEVDLVLGNYLERNPFYLISDD